MALLFKQASSRVVSSAILPRPKIVAGDPPGVLVVVALGLVLPAAVIAAQVVTIVKFGAILPDPFAVARVQLAFLPRRKLFTGDPIVITPVLV